MTSRTSVTRSDIARALRGAGLRPGDRVLLHSSLSSMGWVEGGADAVIDAFLDVLDPRQGTLMVPTFGLCEGPWDPARVPSSTGRITETLRLRPQAIRSIHPSHSVAAIGRDAARLTAGHLEAEANGVGSPIDRLAQSGGYVLLLGVGHDRNTTIHTAEVYAGAPYVRLPSYPEFFSPRPVRLPNGHVVPKAYSEPPGCSRGFGVVEGPLHEKGVVVDFFLGTARCQLMKGKALIDAVGQMIRHQPDVLLCPHADCWCCTTRRAFVLGMQGS